MKKRRKLIADLTRAVSQLVHEKRFEELTYIDVIQALSNEIANCLGWHRKRTGYRRVKGERP